MPCSCEGMGLTSLKPEFGIITGHLSILSSRSHLEMLSLPWSSPEALDMPYCYGKILSVRGMGREHSGT